MYSQSPCTPINEIVCSLFFNPNYLSKNFLKNYSFCFWRHGKLKKMQMEVLFESEQNKVGPAADASPNIWAG